MSFAARSRQARSQAATTALKPRIEVRTNLNTLYHFVTRMQWHHWIIMDAYCHSVFNCAICSQLSEKDQHWKLLHVALVVEMYLLNHVWLNGSPKRLPVTSKRKHSLIPSIHSDGESEVSSPKRMPRQVNNIMFVYTEQAMGPLISTSSME